MTSRQGYFFIILLGLVGAATSCGSNSMSTPIVMPGTPTMIQHVSTASNQQVGNMGSPFFISLPNPTGAGNALIVGVSYPFASGRTVTISDDKSNTWTLGATTPANPSNGQMVSRLYYALNIANGTQKVTVTFDNPLFDFQAVASEFYNVATVAAADGSSGNATSAAPNVSSGSFSTTAAGDLIYSYAFNNNLSTHTAFASGSGFTLLSADHELDTVAEYGVQTAAGSINAGVTVTGGADTFNAVALALKSAAAGTPPTAGIRIVHVYHVLYQSGGALQFPSSGNLLVCVTAFGEGNTNVSAITTNPGNTWTKAAVPQPNFDPQIWYAANASTGPGLALTPTSSLPGITLIFYDVAGAAASPFDNVSPDVEKFNAANANLLGMPVVTPTTANGLIIAVMANGTGPSTAMVGAGLTLDTITYGHEVDQDVMDNADGYAHFYNSTTASVSFGWVMNSGMPEDSLAVGIAFKAP